MKSCVNDLTFQEGPKMHRSGGCVKDWAPDPSFGCLLWGRSGRNTRKSQLCYSEKLEGELTLQLLYLGHQGEFLLL